MKPFFYSTDNLTINFDKCEQNIITILKSNLNTEQLIATTNIEGNYLVIAGAGSGKTRILIYRAFFIHSIYPTKKILLITFTQNSAIELKERLLLLDDSNNTIIETFHSLAYKIVKKYGKNKFFSILTAESINKFSTKYFTNEELLSLLYLSLHNREKFYLNISSLSKNLQTILLNILTKLKVYKEKNNLYLFDELIIKAITILNNNFYIKFDYIMVDEYQDSDSLQLEFLKSLSKNSNLMVVGDDFQSIYSFKGGSSENIFHFRYTFPNVHIIFLTMNYRSTKGIVDFSNSIQYQFDKYIPKILKHNYDNNLLPVLTVYSTLEKEIDGIISAILNLKNSSIAILFRNYIYMEPFIKKLLEYKIPFSIPKNERLNNFFHISCYENGYVHLLTIHGSKGLEWDYVFIPMLLNGIFPTAIGHFLNTEEEKHLFYVACTRGRKNIFLSYPLFLYNDYGLFQEISPFIKKIPRMLYELKKCK